MQDGLAAGLPVSIQFLEQAGPGYFAAVDTDNRLQQLGWQREPTLMHLAWAGQWLHYTAGLKRRLAEPALVLPIFEKQVRLESNRIILSLHFWSSSRTLCRHHSEHAFANLPDGCIAGFSFQD